MIRRRLITAKHNKNSGTFTNAEVILLPQVDGRRLMTTPVKYSTGDYISISSVSRTPNDYIYILSSSNLTSSWQNEKVFVHTAYSWYDYGGAVGGAGNKMFSNRVYNRDGSREDVRYSYLEDETYNTISSNVITTTQRDDGNFIAGYTEMLDDNDFFANRYYQRIGTYGHNYGLAYGRISDFGNLNSEGWGTASDRYRSGAAIYPLKDEESGKILLAGYDFNYYSSSSSNGTFKMMSADSSTNTGSVSLIYNIDGGNIFRWSYCYGLFKVDNTYYLDIMQENDMKRKFIKSTNPHSSNWLSTSNEKLPDTTASYKQLGQYIVGIRNDGNTTKIYSSKDLVDWTSSEFDNNGFNVNNRGIFDWQEDSSYYYYLASNVNWQTVSGDSSIIRFKK